MRPDSPEPWIGDETNIQEIFITVSEEDEPTYVESITFNEINNVDELQIRVVKTPGSTPETVLTVDVRYTSIPSINSLIYVRDLPGRPKVFMCLTHCLPSRPLHL